MACLSQQAGRKSLHVVRHPSLGSAEGIVGSRDKDMLIGRIYADAHYISQAIPCREFCGMKDDVRQCGQGLSKANSPKSLLYHRELRTSFPPLPFSHPLQPSSSLQTTQLMTNIYIVTGDANFPRANDKQAFGVSTDRKQGRYCRGLHTLLNCLLERKRKSQPTRIVMKLYLGNSVGSLACPKSSLFQEAWCAKGVLKGLRCPREWSLCSTENKGEKNVVLE